MIGEAEDLDFKSLHVDVEHERAGSLALWKESLYVSVHEPVKKCVKTSTYEILNTCVKYVYWVYWVPCVLGPLCLSGCFILRQQPVKMYHLSSGGPVHVYTVCEY